MAPDAARLVEVAAGGGLLIVNVKGVDAEIQESGMVALRATILTPGDLAPSGTEIVLQMLPIDADKFAETVHAAAKREAWKFPGDAKFVKWEQKGKPSS